MKNLLINAIAFILVFSACSHTAGIVDLFQKYGNRDGFTSIFINNPVAISTYAGDTNSTGFAREIRAIRILKFDSGHKKNVHLGKEFTADLEGIISSRDYFEFMSVSKDNKDTKIYYRKDDSTARDLFITSLNKKGETTLIWLEGSVGLENLAALGRFVNIFKK